MKYKLINKQTVYLPEKMRGADGNYIPDDSVLIVKEQGEMDKYWIDLVKPQEGYFFTPEQLNEYTANVIKQALEDNKDRKYTKEDIRKAWNAAYIDAMSIDEETYKPLFFEDFIQSLHNKTEWEVEIVDGKLKLK